MLEVDGLVVVVDEDLLHKPAAVVQPFGPLGDIFVLYLLGLLAHPRLLLPSVVSFYPEEANVSHRRELEPLFTGVRGREILRTSPLRSSRKFAWLQSTLVSCLNQGD